MSTRLSTALVRFCLVGLMAVARVLCPCPAVEAAHAAHPSEAAAHSCCAETRGEKNPAHHPSGHSHADGCQHCAESPRLTSAASEGAEAALAPPGDAVARPDNFRPESATTIVLRPFQLAAAAYPPPAPWRIRTVVLLI